MIGNIIYHKMDSDINQIRLYILNQLRIYNGKFKNQYGQMVICLEGGSWRKDVFPEYKANRKKTRDASDLDWNFIFSSINQIIEEIKQTLPYIVIQSDGAEADDIIGVLAKYTEQFGKHEEVMIVSSDKDFMQLQMRNNIKQFSTKHKKLITVPDPYRYIQEQILKGDREDGVPNALSPNNALVSSVRQTPMRQTFIDEALASDDIEVFMEQKGFGDTYRRNRQMIHLDYTPQEIVDDVVTKFEAGPTVTNKMRLLNYLIKNKCKNLVENIQEF